MKRDRTWCSGFASSLAVVLLLAAALPAWGAGALEEIKSRGSIQACVGDSPYIQKDPATGQWTGYDAELATMYAKHLGVKFEWVDVGWGNIVPSLLAKKCDVIWAALFGTPERAKVVDFSRTVHNTGLLVVVREGDNRFQSYEDLNKPTVTFAELPDISEQEAKKGFPNATIKIIQSDNVNAPALEVVANRADANLTDALLAYELVKKKAGVRIVQGPIIAMSNIVFAVRKDSQDLLSSINNFLAETDKAGALEKLAQRYGIPPGFK